MANIKITGMDIQEFPHSSVPVTYPVLHVYDGNTPLNVNGDYKITYYKNNRVGVATILFQGIGSYDFKIYKHFTIYFAPEARIERMPLLSDISMDESDTYRRYNSLVAQDKFQEAQALLDGKNRQDGLRASFFNEFEQKLIASQEYLQNFERNPIVHFSNTEPTEMGSCIFWECEY